MGQEGHLGEPQCLSAELAMHLCRQAGLCLSNPPWESSRRINKITGRGRAMPIIYLSFQKAFDKVPHRRLLRKLGNHRMRGKAKAWIKTKIRQGGTGRSKRPIQQAERLIVESPEVTVALSG